MIYRVRYVCCCVDVARGSRCHSVVAMCGRTLAAQCGHKVWLRASHPHTVLVSLQL